MYSHTIDQTSVLCMKFGVSLFTAKRSLTKKPPISRRLSKIVADLTLVHQPTHQTAKPSWPCQLTYTWN